MLWLLSCGVVKASRKWDGNVSDLGVRKLAASKAVDLGVDDGLGRCQSG